MTRVATDENEAYLLEIAHHSNANEVELAVRQFQQVGEVDTLETLMAKRALICYQDYDGMWVIKAKLPQHSGALVVNALKAITDNQQKSVPAETSEPKMTDKPTFVFKTPDGQVLQTNDEPKQSHDTTAHGTLDDYDQRWPDINSETIKPDLWDVGLNGSMVMNDMIARTGGAAQISSLGP